MPEMTLLGWFHTIAGVIAVSSGFYTLYKYKIISSEQQIGRVYILVTAIVAGSALGIYNQGSFGVAHVLGVLTLVALAGGYIMERYQWFGSFSKYFQALDKRVSLDDINPYRFIEPISPYLAIKREGKRIYLKNYLEKFHERAKSSLILVEGAG